MPIYGGIDLGGTKIQAAVVDEHHAVLGAKRDETPLQGGPAAIAAKMAAVLQEAAAAAGVRTSELVGVGVGSPGSVDARAGTVATARNLSGWEGVFPLGPTLAQALGTRVTLGNDVQLATDAEFAIGAASAYRSLLGVFWGTGVGGGIVIDGRAWVGRKTAGEIGHMVVHLDGARCTCGRKGCLEAYAGRGAMELRARHLADKGSKTQLFKIMAERGRDRLSSGIWQRALEHGDGMAQELIERAVAALGAGVASAVNLLDPEAVVIGGGLGIRLGEPYVEKIRQAMLPHLFVDDDPPPILLAQLGDLGGAQGGALLAAKAASRRAGT